VEGLSLSLSLSLRLLGELLALSTEAKSPAGVWVLPAVCPSWQTLGWPLGGLPGLQPKGWVRRAHNCLRFQDCSCGEPPKHCFQGANGHLKLRDCSCDGPPALPSLSPGLCSLELPCALAFQSSLSVGQQVQCWAQPCAQVSPWSTQICGICTQWVVAAAVLRGVSCLLPGQSSETSSAEWKC